MHSFRNEKVIRGLGKDQMVFKKTKFIITDKINSIRNVTFINEVDIGNDYIMVVCRTKFNFRTESK